MEENKRICRLCLSVSRNELYPVEETTRDIFDILLLKLDFSQTNEPVMCSNCAEGIRKFFEFKSACLYTEDRVAPFANTLNGSKIDLIEVAYMNENEAEESVNMQVNAICRFCMKCKKRDACIALDTLEEDFEKDVIATCLPEINLKITSKPTICTECMESLTGYYGLITTCLDVEKNINDYCISLGVKEGEKIDLGKVYRFVIWNTLGQNDSYNNAVNIKLEDEDDLALGIKTEEIEINDENECVESLQGKTSPPMKNHERPGRPRKATMLKCPKCIYEAPYKSHMTRHSLTHVEPSKKCGVNYKHEDGLKDHIQRVHGHASKKKIYKCTQCSYSSKDRNNYKSHLVCHGNPTEDDCFQCAKCPFMTPRKSCIRNHVRIHMDPATARPFQCEDCSYRAYNRARLRQHRVVHEEVPKSYECHLCVFRTTGKNGLRNHITRMHKPSENNAVVLRCHSCHYQTIYKKYLVRHMKVHRKRTQEAPAVRESFTCHVCAYETRSKVMLMHHILEHRKLKLEGMYTTRHPLAVETEGKYYDCYTCGFRARCKMTLKKHMLEKHKRQAVNNTSSKPVKV